jgi:hypothetical protein
MIAAKRRKKHKNQTSGFFTTDVTDHTDYTNGGPSRFQKDCPAYFCGFGRKCTND